MTEAELRLILEEGEDYRHDFKEAVSDLAEDIVAFANASGGRILIGVAADHSVPGITNMDEAKSRVQNTAAHCDPPLSVAFEEVSTVLVAHVPEGADKPYRCSKGFYLRVGPNSQKLNRDQIVEFLKAEGKVRFDELEHPGFEFGRQFDRQKLGKFLARAGITEVLDLPVMLRNLGAANDRPGSASINNAGILFFARNLDHTYRHTVVTCVLYKGTRKVDVLDRKDFNDDLLASIESAMVFLKQHLRVAYEFTGAPQRKDVPEIPHEALREAVINAVCHRDYFERGANAMIEIFDDRVEISNPGGLPRGLKPAEFGTRSVARNPSIANLLHRLDYIEKMGTGIGRIQNWMSTAGLPPAMFAYTTFFTVVFTRPKLAEGRHLAEPFSENFRINFRTEFMIKGRRLERMVGIITLAARSALPKADDLAAQYRITVRVIYADLRFLREKDLLKLEGSRKTGSYVLTAKGKALLKEPKP